MEGEALDAAELRGLVTRSSSYSYAETLARIEAAIAERGLTMFARFDHAAAARAVGMAMPDTCVVVFGNPRQGTPVMLASPTIAFELPLRVLVRADAEGRVWVSYADPAELARRHQVPDALVPAIAAVGGLVAASLSARSP